MNTPPEAAELAQDFGSAGARRYGEIAAEVRLAPRDQTAEVLQRHGLTKSEWRSQSERWQRAITEALATENSDVLLAYADAFWKTERRLKEATDPEALAGPTEPEAREPLPAPVPVTPALATFQQQGLAPSEVVITDLEAGPPAPRRGPRPELASTTGINLAQLVTPALPFASSSASAGVPHVLKTPHAPATAPQSAPMGATTDLNLSEPVEPALPFGIGAPRVEAPRAPQQDLASTTDANLGQIARAVMPFANAPQAAVSSASPVRGLEFDSTVKTDFQQLVASKATAGAAATETASPPRRAPRRDFGLTADAGFAEAVKAVLPFIDAEQVANLERPAGVGMGTMALPVQPEPRPDHPFTSPAAPLPDMGVEEYAQLCVELADPGGRPDETLARHRIPNQTVLAALHEHWQVCFTIDAALAERWQALRAAYREHHPRDAR